MRSHAVHGFVAAMCVLAVVMLVVQDWSGFATLSTSDYWGVGTLAVLALVAEMQRLSIKVGGDSGGSSIGFLPLFTLLLLFGPAAALGTMVMLGLVMGYGLRRKELLRANFNIAQWVVSTALGGMAFVAAGGEPLVGLEATGHSSAVLAQLGPFVLFGVVLLWVNNAAVAMVMSLSQQLPYRDVWVRLVGPAGTNILADLLIAPIAIAVAALYLSAGPVGLLLAILPFFFIRHSYQTTHQLQLANKDLLKALVKAIEIRDPYTSGHSLRVSHLAKRIAEQLALPPRHVNGIEAAGLVHDIGKVEAVFTEILRKPDPLTWDERKIIESHVERGVELLKNLSSMSDEVIEIVRHHHEREDGKGYPDRLLGDQIPVGAKIIIVCDAVDAMLSDRPYRKALGLSVVRAELERQAGKQFDHRVVRALTESGTLPDHVEIMNVDPEGLLGVADAPAPAKHLRPQASTKQPSRHVRWSRPN